MISPKRRGKQWLKRKEEIFPGYTYFAAAFLLIVFYTTLATSELLGRYAMVADVSIYVLGLLSFLVVYREELREAWTNAQ